MPMASTTMTGTVIAFPDVCKTPPFAIPAPFPNSAMNAMVIPAYFTIMINCLPELNLGCMYATTTGDEGGALGGVASGIIKGPARPVMGSLCYFVGGMPSYRLTDPTINNLSNAIGSDMVPSQTTKQVLR